ncbi:MAG: heme-binding domain-containing protein [Aliarcobacter sp.]|uniref:Heme-binding domain-containing protein n=1 Tax=Arcobacter aquimarinus TaxID=1315211 RepID=A0AAE7B0R7_9BACT|nr:heme-binding domain-containing protein [Arcobacter aquimarinus]QKE25293.1 heme-binding domain-containing protein [Arcobacter aquimarinus]RXI36704.1 cytochrome C [Arcobacter aquimarinus]
MKLTLLIFLIIFIVMQFIQPNKENIVVDKNLEIKAPTEVMNLFKTSCFDCHSNETTWPWYSKIAPFSWVVANHVNTGRKALNFSTWENYSPQLKEEKLKAIYRTAYASMPLPSYIYAHEEANLTKEQRSMIRDWTGVRSK